MIFIILFTLRDILFHKYHFISIHNVKGFTNSKMAAIQEIKKFIMEASCDVQKKKKKSRQRLKVASVFLVKTKNTSSKHSLKICHKTLKGL